MPVIQLPLLKGVGKNPFVADYVDLLPVNMLAVPKEVLNASGYMRTFPGVRKTADVAGTSRGAQYNTKETTVYRVLGTKLYSAKTALDAVIPGADRVSMAHSYNSQGVAAGGKLLLWNYDEKKLKTLENWPETVIKQKGYKKSLSAAPTFYIPDEAMRGKITVTLTPTAKNGTTGESLTISEEQWNSEQSQKDPGGGKPWLTAVKISGEKRPGAVAQITWKYRGLESSDDDATTVSVDLTVDKVSLKYAQYDIGSVRDICHNRSRYIWVKSDSDTFGVTDLEDESHPDQYRPFYRAESQPDGIQGVASWRDMVVCFGSSTIEYFSLTGSANSTDPVYIAQPSLMVNIGIAGTHCKCSYGDSFAVLSHPASGAPSVYVVDSGSKKSIATASVEKILAGYSAAELAAAYMESVRFEAHELLIIHLARHVLCFDGSASQNGPQWNILKSGLYDSVWRGVDLVWDGGAVTVGDKNQGVLGALDFSISSQYDDAVEFVLYTPLVKLDNALLFDFEIESAAALAVYAEKCFISATTDGSNYGREQLIPSNDTFRYDQRVIWRQVGRCRKNIGFKIRLVTKTPAAMAYCQLRSGYGR